MVGTGQEPESNDRLTCSDLEAQDSGSSLTDLTGSPLALRGNVLELLKLARTDLSQDDHGQPYIELPVNISLTTHSDPALYSGNYSESLAAIPDIRRQAFMFPDNVLPAQEVVMLGRSHISGIYS